MGIKLTSKEKRFLRELRAMEREHEKFTYLRIAERLSLKGVSGAWQYVEQLERKGYIAIGERLAVVGKQPVVTKVGLKVLGERKAA